MNNKSGTYGTKLTFIPNGVNNTYHQSVIDHINEHNNMLVYAPYVLYSLLEEDGISVWLNPSESLERVREWAYLNDDEYVFELLEAIK